jgi:hypothetical protein
VEDPSAHVGMEVGLDLALLERVPDVSRPPAAPFFRGGDVRLLAAALERTYGLPWSPHHLLLNHRRAVRLTALWPRAMGVLGMAWSANGAARGPAGTLIALVQRSGRTLSRRNLALRGFLGPLSPPSWLMEGVLSFGGEIPGRMDELVRAGPDALEDRNLETGEAAGPGLGHAASDQAARELRLRAG